MELTLSNPQMHVLGLGLVWLLLRFSMLYFLERFREKLKVDELVGVRFGEDLVLNRKILRLSPDKKWVWVHGATLVDIIPLEVSKIFLPDMKAPSNLRVN